MSQPTNIRIFDEKDGKDGGNDEKSLAIHLNEETLKDRAKTTKELFNTIQEELDQHDADLTDGLSFLDMKNDTLLSYMIDVCNIVLRKVRGDSIEGHQSVERCVEYRVVLERIRAIDQKLSYQLNKLITMPEDAEEEDRLDVRNLDIDIDDGETGEENDESNSSQESYESEAGSQSEKEDDSDNDDYSDADLQDDSGSLKDESVSKKMRKVMSKGQGEGKGKGNGKAKSRNESFKAKEVYKPPKLRSVAYLEAGEDRVRRKNYDEIYQEQETDEIVDRVADRQFDAKRVEYEEDNYTRIPDQNPKKLKRKLKTKEYRRKGKKNKIRRRR